NNVLHRPFLELLEEVPGHVLFHDVRLSDCYTPDERQAMAERFYPDDTHPRPLYAAAVARAARSCLVHSRHAADVLPAGCGGSATNVGPLPMKPSLVTAVEPVTPAPDEGVWIVTAGVADVVKQTHVFVAAAEIVLARRPEWNAAVVGLGGERFVDDESKVIATGRVSALDYPAWMARATVLVQ